MEMNGEHEGTAGRLPAVREWAVRIFIRYRCSNDAAFAILLRAVLECYLPQAPAAGAWAKLAVVPPFTAYPAASRLQGRGVDLSSDQPFRRCVGPCYS